MKCLPYQCYCDIWNHSFIISSVNQSNTLFLSLPLFQRNWGSDKENALPKHVSRHLLNGKDLNLIFHAYSLEKPCSQRVPPAWCPTGAPPQPLGLRCCCEQTKHSKRKVSWLCSAVRYKKNPFHLKYQIGYWRSRPHAASLAQVTGAGLWWEAAPSEGDSVILLCPAPRAHCCRWRWTQPCWRWREAVTVGSEFMTLISTGGGAAC